MSEEEAKRDVLSTAIAQVAAEAPNAAFERLLAVLDTRPDDDAQRLRWEVEQAVPGIRLRRSVDGLITAWSRIPGMTATAVALALRSARLAAVGGRDSVELVWTGPATTAVPVRRTDQVLLTMIEASRADLLIVSFAVYQGKRWTAALRAAVDRGVRTTFVVETSASGKITSDGLLALDTSLRSHLKVLTWALDRRPRDLLDKPGTLHAKFAVADRTTVLISSANLTEHAMTLNLEMGVKITGGMLPTSIARLVDELEDQGELIPVL